MSLAAIIDLGVDRDLHNTRNLLMFRRDGTIDGVHGLALGLDNGITGLVVVPVVRLAVWAQRNGVRALRRLLEAENRAAGAALSGDDVGRRMRVGVGRGDGEGAALGERATDGENDTEGH